MDIFDFYRFCQSEFLNKITNEDKLLNDKFFNNNDITVKKIQKDNLLFKKFN